ncbi:tripartite tricarboxylate transporter permease [Sedimentibacter hydroxybenzoicus DSM 7310]|uniref:Tripartite tricarboxylate transporter permease n=1 Tax=Sedimentibacter hydroxybenzoicus DSM 7310 TaxID=1123245 RepID=A0A974BLA7_SEDHY|nr:tripartite tricarboxylate transporter permease [Sedimentibacter hydroxybenzoicus]NYB74822.1 tripartite tricarboxylate transporter permease [Sedimentibacter hydroxybenzoicus DSM 7310]
MIEFELIYILYIFAGCVIGLVMGALPGLTVTMTIVLVVSLTFGWAMIPALAFIIGAFAGGVMGGSISAIALNIPGTAAAVSTVFDGYPMKLKGEANNALGISLFVSLIGGIFGLAILGLVGPLLGKIALKFGPQEYFLITLWGITLVAVLSQGKMTKGLIAAFIGIFVGMIGMDPITGLMRFTLGSKVLSGGINYIAAMIGLFGMKEVLTQLKRSKTFKIDENYKIKDLFPKKEIIKRIAPTMTWSAVIGWIIGLLPGTGGDIGSLVAYGATKSIVKNPNRPFGEGSYEGVAAPETANDAAIGGALTTMLTLGIPGDSITAVIIGAFYMHGLLPGPTFMITEKRYFYYILIFLAIGIVFAYLSGLLGANIMLKVLKFPKWALVPTITMLCIIGSYALQNSINDVIIMTFFGFIGYLFEKCEYPVSPIVLGIILGPMIETNFRQALISAGSVSSLLMSFITRPLALAILILVVASFVLQSFTVKSNKKSEAEN